jgi:hypothetical protein
MYCAACGHHDLDIGGEHSCAARTLMDGRPSALAGWQVLAWVVLALIAAYVAASVARIVVLVQNYRLINRVADHRGGTTVAQVHEHFALLRTVSDIYQLLLIAAVVSAVAWFALLRSAVARYGDDGKAALTHWSLIGFRLALLASAGIAIATIASAPSAIADLPSARDSLLTFDQNQIIFTALRIVAAALLIMSVWVIRDRVRTLVGQRTIGEHITRVVQLRQARRHRDV